MNEELDSQLSAMFDDELPPAQCELLARRLARDGELKARWGRYAVMGALLRAERGVRLSTPLAGRVIAALRTEPELAAPAAALAGRSSRRWWQPLAAGGLAAGVAAAAVLWLRLQGAGLPTVASVAPPAAPLAAAARNGAAPAVRARDAGRADSYVVPRARSAPAVPVPSTQLANYVVAHSMVASPVARGNLLSAFITGEAAAEEAHREPPRDAPQ